VDCDILAIHLLLVESRNRFPGPIGVHRNEGRTPGSARVIGHEMYRSNVTVRLEQSADRSLGGLGG
jgi:hypothetical protein